MWVAHLATRTILAAAPADVDRRSVPIKRAPGKLTGKVGASISGGTIP